MASRRDLTLLAVLTDAFLAVGLAVTLWGLLAHAAPAWESVGRCVFGGLILAIGGLLSMGAAEAGWRASARLYAVGQVMVTLAAVAVVVVAFSLA